MVLVHHNFCAWSYHFSIEKSLYVCISECSSHVLLGINWVDHLCALNNTPTVVVYDYLFCSCINHCGFACSSLIIGSGCMHCPSISRCPQIQLLFSVPSSILISWWSMFVLGWTAPNIVGLNMATHKHRIKNFKVRINSCMLFYYYML
jgi:hypothetical protein